MVFNLEHLEHKVEVLDRSTNLLDKFMRNVTANHQPGQNTPSRKTAKLAKALQVVRHNAVNLHSALIRQWIISCHQRHELKVFLEDRITEPKYFWHETLFHIEAEDSQTTGTPLPLQGPHIQFSTPQRQPTNSRLNVPDICAVITSATCRAHYPIFYLAGTRNMAMTLHTQASATTQSSRSPSTTLQKIFQDRHNQNSPSSPFPWKWRMVLALKIASSFLQFIRTSWMQPS